MCSKPEIWDQKVGLSSFTLYVRHSMSKIVSLVLKQNLPNVKLRREFDDWGISKEKQISVMFVTVLLAFRENLL